MNELEEYIEEIHQEPYSILGNNCIDKHLKIVKKARELGHQADMIGCISVIPIAPAGGFPLVGPHFYAEVDGQMVDVTMQPDLERVICPNDAITRLLPINISQAQPCSPWEGPPLPSGIGLKWPWKQAITI